ncbi:MAG: hypothetical protein AAGB46_14960 [Verrucomicrobiota bacterium]
MDDSGSKDEKKDSEKPPVDLSQLSDFSFGTQWSEIDKSSSGGRGGQRSDSRRPRGDRPDRRPGGGGGPRKDRRPKKRAFGGGQGESGGFQGGGQREHSGGRSHGERRPRRDFGERGGGRRQFQDRPFESQVFDVGFYPDDAAFTTIIKAMRTNHLTYELFDVAKTFLVKYDRFITSITRKAAKGEKPEKVFISVPDSMPFDSEDSALLHAVTNYAETFFSVEEVEAEAPAGNFQFVNRCPFTKVLLGPPNYHKYEENLRHHHRTRLSNMPFEKLQNSVETVREEEVVNEWLDSMKKVTRYTTKAAEGEETQSFDSMEGAIGHVRANLKALAVKAVNYARVSGKTLEKFADSEAAKAAAGELERQRKFPLETANAIRGRMRREKFSIYKKGAKGVTYVCSTKRNFRIPGQVMSDNLDSIIHFLEENQSVKTKEFPVKYGEWLKTKNPDATVEEKQMFQDLHWLIADGYVTHFSDDTLFVQPVLDNAPKPKPEKETAPTAEASAPEASPATAEEPTSEPNGEAAPASAAPSDEAKDGEATPAPVVEETPSEPAEEAVAVEAPSSEDSVTDEAAVEAEVAEVAEPEPEAVVEEAKPEEVETETATTAEVAEQAVETPVVDPVEEVQLEVKAEEPDGKDGPSDPADTVAASDESDGEAEEPEKAKSEA